MASTIAAAASAAFLGIGMGLKVRESDMQRIYQRLDRIEDKVDRIIERHSET